MSGNGKVEIVPEEAEVVRLIFQMYLDGSTPRHIAEILTEKGTITANGNSKWDATAIRKMLANEKYMGDALSQKTFIADVLEKKQRKNTGQLPQYYVTDNHEAIIPREIFKRVQFERARRGSLEPRSTKTKGNSGRFSPKYVLSEILLCGECGEHYRRCTWTRNGKTRIVWRCINRLENGKRNCRESPTLDEGALHEAILGFLRNLQSPRDELVQNLREYAEEALEHRSGDSKKKKLLDMLEQKNKLLQEMLSLDIVPDEKIEQLSREYDEIQEQIDSLGDVRNGMEQENAYIRGIREYMESADFDSYEFDDKLIRQVVEQVIVKNVDTLYIRMKGGYEAEITLPGV
jgi:site-specific DNA recombinase